MSSACGSEMAVSCRPTYIATVSRFWSPSPTCLSASSPLQPNSFLLSRISSFFTPSSNIHTRSSKTMASLHATDEKFTQQKITAPYGSWKSPITANVVSGASKRLGGTAVDSHGRLIWLESRPSESGWVSTTCTFLYCYCWLIDLILEFIEIWGRRGVLVKEADIEGGEATDITPKDFAVRTLTQEYGGGAFRVSRDDIVVFSNYKDQRLYKQRINHQGQISSSMFTCR